jgi:tryptophan synthase beta subunit
MIGAIRNGNKIFMGATDVERQSVNVHKMKLCNMVISVRRHKHIKDACDALRY